MLDDLGEARAARIGKRYAIVMNDLGSATDLESVRGQVDFLLACASDAKSKRGLEIVVDAIKE